MACINCDIEFEGDFCPSCGEKENVDRISFFSIIESVFSGFVNMDKGLLFNLKNLTLYPQKTILQYINGKRRQVLNPISYAIITISIYLFIDSLIPNVKSDTSGLGDDPFGAKGMGYKLGGFLHDKMKFLWLTFAVFATFFSKLFFRRFNFFEHLAINCFILGHATIIAILIKLVYSKELIIFNIFVFIYMAYMLYKVFKNPKDAFGTGAIAVVIIIISYILFLGIPFFIANFIL